MDIASMDILNADTQSTVMVTAINQLLKIRKKANPTRNSNYIKSGEPWRFPDFLKEGVV